MKIIAHRGASHDAPENTLAAVRLAWEQNADAVEIDIRLSRDDKLVVIHDANTRRTGGVRRRVCDQTLAELRHLDVGHWKGSRWRGESIPILDEIVATTPDGKKLFVEFKCGTEAITEFRAAISRSGRRSEQIVAIGSSISTMRSVKSALPELEVYWITKFKPVISKQRWSAAARQLISLTQQAGLDGLDVRASRRFNRDFAQQVKTAGLRLFVWTVNSAGQAQRLACAGVDGITTDRPGWLRAKLGL